MPFSVKGPVKGGHVACVLWRRNPTGSGCVLPEAACSRSSLNDTLFLSMAVSDWLTWRGGGVVLLGTLVVGMGEDLE